MTEFASTRTSEAEQRAILALIVSTFDAEEIVEKETGGRAGVYAAGGGSQWDPRRNSSEVRLTPPSGAGPISSENPGVPPAPKEPNWTQPLLWEGEAA